MKIQVYCCWAEYGGPKAWECFKVLPWVRPDCLSLQASTSCTTGRERVQQNKMFLRLNRLMCNAIEKIARIKVHFSRLES